MEGTDRMERVVWHEGTAGWSEPENLRELSGVERAGVRERTIRSE